ncbi:GNAT family N-acetyltransferase [Undibacterium griseum]|uniref:GNAT family N-acetyltransferase n=1 Tax=Undibacterium griseum TaxID=2762295 RepID=A0ABR6YKB9_9BURK|nr:GNAT family N-acetyltransferase [Undibacterium griseum]MBC3884346.1 GNAT family N-acetyltransferase [Undibacterium griseum]
MTAHHFIFRQNTATQQDVLQHFTQCDREFFTQLQQRVDIGSYIEKILSAAERFEIWDGAELKGLLAAYCNCEQRQNVFITNLSVTLDSQRKGLASQLLRRCILHAEKEAYVGIQLQVNVTNNAAYQCYIRHGFRETHISEHDRTMYLSLGVSIV